MARIPSQCALGISMISFAGLLVLAATKHHNSVQPIESGPAFEKIASILAFASGFIGIIVHAANLDSEPCVKSFAMAFAGANVSFGWLYVAVDPNDWHELFSVVVATTIVGLVAGVAIHKGDPQAKLKETIAKQSDLDKRLERAKECTAQWERWEKWTLEQKTKIEEKEKELGIEKSSWEPLSKWSI